MITIYHFYTTIPHRCTCLYRLPRAKFLSTEKVIPVPLAMPRKKNQKSNRSLFIHILALSDHYAFRSYAYLAPYAARERGTAVLARFRLVRLATAIAHYRHGNRLDVRGRARCIQPRSHGRGVVSCVRTMFLRDLDRA